MNAPKLHRQVTADDGRAAQLAASELTPDEIVEETVPAGLFAPARRGGTRSAGDCSRKAELPAARRPKI